VLIDPKLYFVGIEEDSGVESDAGYTALCGHFVDSFYRPIYGYRDGGGANQFRQGRGELLFQRTTPKSELPLRLGFIQHAGERGTSKPRRERSGGGFSAWMYSLPPNGLDDCLDPDIFRASKDSLPRHQ
jgi:hypothetical protein